MPVTPVAPSMFSGTRASRAGKFFCFWDERVGRGKMSIFCPPPFCPRSLERRTLSFLSRRETPVLEGKIIMKNKCLTFLIDPGIVIIVTNYQRGRRDTET